MVKFYRMTFSESDLEATELAFTNNPAIEVYDGVFLSKDESEFIELSNLIELNNEKQILAAVALRADKWIERIDKNTGEKYYITFTPESVEQYKLAFEKNGAIMNIEHTDKKIKTKLLFSGIVGNVGEDKIRDEFNYNGKLYNSDYFVAIQIENKEDWEYVKANKMNAFSIHAFFNKNKIEFKKESVMEEQNLLKQIEELKAKLSAYESETKEETKVEVEAETEEVKEEEVIAETDVETETEVETETTFVFTEDMYKDLIQKVAELEDTIEKMVLPVEDQIESVQMNKNLSSPAKFLQGFWSNK